MVFHILMCGLGDLGGLLERFPATLHILPICDSSFVAGQVVSENDKSMIKSICQAKL